MAQTRSPQDWSAPTPVGTTQVSTSSGEVAVLARPWLVRSHPDGDGWHMLVTATARDGEVGGRGVLGHAWSPDLLTWRVLPPLSRTDSGFWPARECRSWPSWTATRCCCSVDPGPLLSRAATQGR